MKRQLWELSAEELEKEITTTKAILDAGGYNKLVSDHLNLLQEQLEERKIEDSYGGDAA